LLSKKIGASLALASGLCLAVACGGGANGGNSSAGNAQSGNGAYTGTSAIATGDISAGNPTGPTTLAAETANNTSASSSFNGTSNGNIKPASVSKVSLHTLLYPGATTKIYVHVMPWWGSSGHINIGYNSADPAQVTRQVDDMISRGIDGLIVDWYGPANAALNNATLALSQEAQNHSGFEFAICEDAGALQGASNPTAKLISDLAYIYQTYETSPNYMRKNGRPVIVLFGEESVAINWSQVAAAVQGNPLFVWENNVGFTQPDSSGAFSWIGITGNPADPGLGYLSSFYQTAASNTTEQTFGSYYKGFNDSIASWGTNRVVNQNCGQTWLSTMAEISSYYNPSQQLESIQIPTWNDYEEGDEIETGIDNCVSISAALSGQTLNWSLSGQESTIDHYTVFVSPDGQTLNPVGEVQPGTHSINIGSFSLAAGSYTVYVEAIGKPSLLNHMSGAVAFSR